MRSAVLSLLNTWLCRLFFLTALCCSVAVQAQSASTGTYPQRPVKLIVPFSPGGLSDTVARLLAQPLSVALGQQVLVENRPGAGGIVATELVAKSPADGYTLLLADPQHLAINPALHSKLPYDAIRDFEPITLAAYGPLFLALHSAVAASNFAEFTALAKARPGKLSYGSAGSGSIHHLSMESLKAAAGLDIVHVPFKGAAQAMPALVGAQVEVVFAAYPSLAPQVKAGKVRILAVSTGKRTRLAPEVPTLAELGVRGYDFAGQIGLVAPAGTPREVIARLHGEIVKALRQPELIERMTALGIDPVGNTPEDYARLIRADMEKFARAVKISGAVAE